MYTMKMEELEKEIKQLDGELEVSLINQESLIEENNSIKGDLHSIIKETDSMNTSIMTSNHKLKTLQECGQRNERLRSMVPSLTADPQLQEAILEALSHHDFQKDWIDELKNENQKLEEKTGEILNVETKCTNCKKIAKPSENHDRACTFHHG